MIFFMLKIKLNTDSCFFLRKYLEQLFMDINDRGYAKIDFKPLP